ncbi:hypothetical protein ACIQMZ_35585 [Streptomyces longwoodensis]|uniref:ATP-dependent DNA ligase n=1 Tax=Streptomyces longwoodensis TaxID=68231 RepID=UPI003805456F
MLTTAVNAPDLPAGWAAEPKWDGFRAQLAVHTGGRVLLRSRQGADMTAAVPEIRATAVKQLPADTGLDGELVVWEHGRLAFERLQQSAPCPARQRRGPGGRPVAGALRGLRPGPRGRDRPDRLAVRAAALRR